MEVNHNSPFTVSLSLFPENLWCQTHRSRWRWKTTVVGRNFRTTSICFPKQSRRNVFLYSALSQKLQDPSVIRSTRFASFSHPAPLDPRLLPYETSDGRVLDACKHRRNRKTAFSAAERDYADLQASFEHCTACKRVVERGSEKKLINKNVSFRVRNGFGTWHWESLI